MKRLLFFCSLGIGLCSYRTTLQVPDNMQVMGIRLHIVQGAKKRIQAKIDSLTRSEKYLQPLVDRAHLFFPVVEKVFKEENLPVDFKYLVLQESALVADVVSVNRDVGFWQFQFPTANEMGLTVNKYIDERMHVVASTRAAARYLKKHQQFYKNWLCALLAYNQGQKGAQKFIKSDYSGAKEMKIGANTHQYIIHFLAYKIVFEKLLETNSRPPHALYEYPEGHGMTLHEIAARFKVSQESIRAHNKWLKRDRIPRDTTCSWMIPLSHQQHVQLLGHTQKERMPYHTDYAQYEEKSAQFPMILTYTHKSKKVPITRINNLIGVVASAQDTISSLAKSGHLSIAKFLALNDLAKNHKVIAGKVYYYQPKRHKAKVHFHIVRQGETWESIAQKYGMKKKSLLLKNRSSSAVLLVPGRILWLRFIRPATNPIAYFSLPACATR